MQEAHTISLDTRCSRIRKLCFDCIGWSGRGQVGFGTNPNQWDVVDVLRSTDLRVMTLDDGTDSRSDLCLRIADWHYFTFPQVFCFVDLVMFA